MSEGAGGVASEGGVFVAAAAVVEDEFVLAGVEDEVELVLVVVSVAERAGVEADVGGVGGPVGAEGGVAGPGEEGGGEGGLCALLAAGGDEAEVLAVGEVLEGGGEGARDVAFPGVVVLGEGAVGEHQAEVEVVGLLHELDEVGWDFVEAVEESGLVGECHDVIEGDLVVSGG